MEPTGCIPSSGVVVCIGAGDIDGGGQGGRKRLDFSEHVPDDTHYGRRSEAHYRDSEKSEGPEAQKREVFRHDSSLRVAAMSEPRLL